MTRVLHVLPTLSGGGAEAFVSSLLPSLSQQGVECGVMTVYPSDVPTADAWGQHIDVINIDRKGRYEAGFLPRMVAAMRAWRPDVVHTHMHNGKYWGRLSALLAGVPAIVHTVHNPCDPHRSLGEPLVDRILNAFSSAIVTFSAAQRAFLCRKEGIAAEKVIVIPNGIRHSSPPTPAAREEARSKLDLAPLEFAVAVIGTLYGPKNQRLAIDAFSMLPRELRERTRLCVIGDGADRGALEERARRAGVAERVTFYGFRSDVQTLLAGLDLLLVPSRTEGMPLAVLEAMSAGVPVLSTPWTGVHDLLEEGQLGAIAADWNPLSLASCLEDAVRDRQRIRRMAERAQMRVRMEYDIDATARRYQRLYASLLAQDRAA